MSPSSLSVRSVPAPPGMKPDTARCASFLIDARARLCYDTLALSAAILRSTAGPGEGN